MAINPYSESSLIATLRAKGISTSDIDDDALLVVIEDALNDYLFYKPKIAITSYADSITTVADQPNYALPDDALWVRQVCWNPSYSATEFEDMWKEILLANYQETNPTVLMIEYGKMAQLNRLFKGRWEILNDEIWLKPCPDGVYNVAVIYAASRTLDELDQIGDRRFLELAYFHTLYAVATKKLTGGGWKAGQWAVSESVGRETMKVAERGLEMTRLRIANSFVGGRS